MFWTSFISVLVLSFTTPFSQVQSFNFFPPHRWCLAIHWWPCIWCAVMTTLVHTVTVFILSFLLQVQITHTQWSFPTSGHSLSSVMEADASPSSSGEPTTRDTLIFSTADECFKKGPACAIENYTMSLRWNIFTFTYEISRPKVVKIHPCGRCFAELVLNN